MRLSIGGWGVLVGLLALPAGVESGDAWSGSARDWCREDDGGGRSRHCEVREVALPAADLYHVEGRPDGGIRVRGVDRGDARLWAKVTARADTEAEAEALAREVRIETAGTIRAIGPQRSGRDQSWSVSYRVEVPRRSSLKLETGNGGLCVDDVVGDIELQAVNGGLHLEGVGGRVHGQTVNGSLHVELTGTEWEGDGLDVRTTNGSLHLSIPSGYNARLVAGTVNGRVHSDLPGTGRSARRPGGRIEADLGRGGRLLRLETTNGAVHVGQP